MAATRRDVQAGAAYVTLYVKNSLLVKGLKDAEAKLKAMGTTITGIGKGLMKAGALITVPLTAATAAFSSMGVQLDRMAARTRTSVEALSGLGYAAQTVGGDVGTIESALGSLQGVMSGAKSMDLGALTALAKLQLSVADLEKLSPDEQFLKIADAVSRIKDPALQSARAAAVFGGAAETLLPILREGEAGFRRLTQEAERNGAILTREQATAARELSREWLKVTSTIKGTANAIAAELAPELKAISQTIREASTGLVRFIRDNRQLAVTIAKVAFGVVAAGAALVAIGKTFTLTAGLFGAMVTTITGGAAIISTALAAITSPITLIGAAIVGGIALLKKWEFEWSAVRAAAGQSLDKIGGLVKSVGRNLSGIGKDAQTAFEGVKDAFKAGDWEGIVNVAMAAVNVAFRSGQLVLIDGWHKALRIIADAWDAMLNAIGDSTAQRIGSLAKDIANTIGEAAKLTALGGAKAVGYGRASGGLLSYGLGYAAKGLAGGAESMSRVMGNRGELNQYGQFVKAWGEELLKEGDRATDAGAKIIEAGDDFYNALDRLQQRANEVDFGQLVKPLDTGLRSEMYRKADESRREAQQELERAQAALYAAANRSRPPATKPGELLKAEGGKGGIENLMIKSGVGTFSAQAATMLGSSGVQERMLQELKKNNAALKQAEQDLNNLADIRADLRRFIALNAVA